MLYDIAYFSKIWIAGGNKILLCYTRITLCYVMN